MKSITLNSKITEAYKVGLIDSRTCNALLRSNRRLLKDCLNINKNNCDELHGFGIKCFNQLKHALTIADLNTFDYKEIFFAALQNGFYFKEDGDIHFLEPNTFDIHYFLTKDKTFQCGFSFGGVGKKKVHYWVYLDKADYGSRWALSKEQFKNEVQ